MLVDSLFELLNIFVAIGVTDRAHCHLRIMQGKIVFGHAADALLATMRNAIQLKLPSRETVSIGLMSSFVPTTATPEGMRPPRASAFRSSTMK